MKARKEADKLACVAWNARMLGYKGPSRPSPALGDAINAGYHYLEVRCLGCHRGTTDGDGNRPGQGENFCWALRAKSSDVWIGLNPSAPALQDWISCWLSYDR